MRRAVQVAAALALHWTALEGAFQSHHGINLVDACFGPDEIGLRRLWALIVDLPPTSAAGRQLGMWSNEDEQGAVVAETLTDAAASLRSLISLWLERGKTYDPDPPRWGHPNRPERTAEGDDEPIQTRESIDAAITAALPGR